MSLLYLTLRCKCFVVSVSCVAIVLFCAIKDAESYCIH